MYPANITGLAGGIKPAGIYAYRDKVRVWLKGPVSKPELARLRGQCGCKDYNELARFVPSYVQRLDLYQPQSVAAPSNSPVRTNPSRPFQARLHCPATHGSKRVSQWTS